MDKKTVMITGGSGGIGRATAEKFAREGCAVYELSRHGKDGAGVTHISADVTDEAQVKAAAEYILDKEGRIDILVNNAGMGISGAVEFTALSDAKKIFDVNFFGQFNCVKAVLPAMRAQRSGCIINLSSVAAPLAIPYQAFYSATKAAVNAMSMALANETRDFGIRVCAIMPGDVKTGFTAAREKTANGDEIYFGRVSSAVAAMERDETAGMPPEKVAAVIYAAAGKKHPKPLYTVGGKYKLFVLINKLLPARAVNYLIGKIYR